LRVFPSSVSPSIAQGLLLLLLLLLGFFHTTRQHHRCVFVFVERKKDPPALLRNFFPDFIITTLHCTQVYQFNVPTFGPGVVFDVDYSVRMEQFRFFTEALTVKRLKSYVDFMVEEAEVCCCTSKSSFKVFATADEAKHAKKKKKNRT
jgi:cytochrome P450